MSIATPFALPEAVLTAIANGTPAIQAYRQHLGYSINAIAVTSGLTVEEVDRIVDVSRPRNAGLDVTGALLFTGARVVQLLEGPASGVKALQDSIFKDLWHHKVIRISNRDDLMRTFSSRA